MNRRKFLTLASVSVVFPTLAAVPRRSFVLEEATISDLQSAMHAGRETAVSLANHYLDRIQRIDRNGPKVNSVIELNPDALSIARERDRERKSGHNRGPLHGVPILLKDNIDTHDRMMTTAGSLALLGSIARRDSFVTQRLRAAGAVILGKTNLSEWANFRGDRSTSGWSARGGLTKNPYALDRNPSGSSSGSGAAVSTNLCAAAIGTETDGSIVSPSSLCGIVGLKPTVGLISRSGIIPISHTQDTAGPMTRTVRDAAILLTALAGFDPRDPATDAIRGKADPDYTRHLRVDGLNGARLGVARRYFRSGPPGQAMEAALNILREAGATLVDPIDDAPLSKASSHEGEILLYEFKAGINAYLTSLNGKLPVSNLQDLIAFNETHRDKELKHFGQETFVRAEKKGPLTDKAYLEALENSRRLSRAEGIDAVMEKYKLDAIIAPTGGPAGKTDLIQGDRSVGGSSSPAAVAGYPSITVPAGEVRGLPLGLSFFGRAWSEPLLLRLAYSFEHAARARIVPKCLPTLG